MQHRVTADEFRSGSERLASRPEVSPRRYRLAAIFHRPHPYFCKFFQRVAAHPEIDLTVYFYSDLGAGSTFDPGYQRSVQWDADILSGFRHRFPRNWSPWPALDRYTGLFHPSLIRELARGYDAILLHGWWGLTSSLVIVTALLCGIPIILHSDKNSIEPPGGWKRRLRNFVFPFLSRRVAAFLAVGQRNAAFYRSLGAADQKIFFAPLAVDNSFFEEQAAVLRPRREALRLRYGIPPEATVILFVGRLVREKGLFDLLSAFRRLSDESAHLVLVGDGPERPTIEAQARSHDLKRVHFPGFQNYSEVPGFYALADVFVLPSHQENWGAVINEAMNFALPIVASDQVGAVADLVEGGRNGFVFSAGDVAELARNLQVLVSQAELRRHLGEESARKVKGWNFDAAVLGLLAAIRAVTQRAVR